MIVEASEDVYVSSVRVASTPAKEIAGQSGRTAPISRLAAGWITEQLEAPDKNTAASVADTG